MLAAALFSCAVLAACWCLSRVVLSRRHRPRVRRRCRWIRVGPCAYYVLHWPGTLALLVDVYARLHPDMVDVHAECLNPGTWMIRPTAPIQH